MRLYVNGALNNTASAPGALAINESRDLHIGARGNLTDETWNGQIDHVAIYDTALPAEHIAAHYAVTTTGQPQAAITNTLKRRIQDITAACPAPPQDGANPYFAINAATGQCTSYWTTASCGWRQVFCDYHDQLILVIATVAVSLLTGGLADVAIADIGAVEGTLTFGGGGLALAGGGVLSTGTIISISAGTIEAIVNGTAVITIAGIDTWLINNMSSTGSGSGPHNGYLGDDWQPRPAAEIPGSSGCEECANEIVDRLGASTEDIKTITPTHTPVLGQYMDEDTQWAFHKVVEFEGHIYDEFGPANGTQVDIWKTLWQGWNEGEVNFDGL